MACSSQLAALPPSPSCFGQRTATSTHSALALFLGYRDSPWQAGRAAGSGEYLAKLHLQLTRLVIAIRHTRQRPNPHRCGAKSSYAVLVLGIAGGGPLNPTFLVPVLSHARLHYDTVEGIITHEISRPFLQLKVVCHRLRNTTSTMLRTATILQIRPYTAHGFACVHWSHRSSIQFHVSVSCRPCNTEGRSSRQHTEPAANCVHNSFSEAGASWLYGWKLVFCRSGFCPIWCGMHAMSCEGAGSVAFYLSL